MYFLEEEHLEAPPDTGVIEYWNGSGWTETADLNTS